MSSFFQSQFVTRLAKLRLTPHRNICHLKVTAEALRIKEGIAWSIGLNLQPQICKLNARGCPASSDELKGVRPLVKMTYIDMPGHPVLLCFLRDPAEDHHENNVEYR